MKLIDSSVQSDLLGRAAAADLLILVLKGTFKKASSCVIDGTGLFPTLLVTSHNQFLMLRSQTQWCSEKPGISDQLSRLLCCFFSSLDTLVGMPLCIHLNSPAVCT